MDYFAPYNRALENAGAISDNGLAQAYKLHDFETKQRAAKLEYEAKKLAYDDVKRRHELETTAREAAANAKPAYSEQGGYSQQAPSPVADLMNAGAAFTTGPATTPANMPAQQLSQASNGWVQPQGVPQEVAGQVVEHPANKIKVYLDTIAAKDPAAALEIKGKLYEEFKKQVPPGISAADALAKFNEFFGESNVAAPTPKNLIHVKKDELIYNQKPDGSLEKVAEGNSKDESALIDQKAAIAEAAQARLFAQQEKLAMIRQEGLIRAINAKDNKNGQKPLPPSVVKAQAEDLDAIGTASSINADLGVVQKQLESGKLKLGAVSNAIGTGLNKVGLSSENSRNLATFKSTLEKLRNDSLRLNKGVQTDGDAQRAWNELFANINDEGVVKQRLAEIENINSRAVQLRKLNLDTMRAEYGKEPLDVSSFTRVAPALGGKPAPSSRPLPKF